MKTLTASLALLALLPACSTTTVPHTAAEQTAEALRWERQFKACAVAYVDRYPAAQTADRQAQQAVAVCSAVLSAYQLRQRDGYLASHQASDSEQAWAMADSDSRRLEQATLLLVQHHLQPTLSAAP